MPNEKHAINKANEYAKRSKKVAMEWRGEAAEDEEEDGLGFDVMRANRRAFPI